MTLMDWYTLLGSSGVLGVIGLVLRSALKSAVNDLAAHLTPNGGNSLYDQASQTKELADETKNLAKKALEIAVQTEANVRVLEKKVDGLYLSRIP